MRNTVVNKETPFVHIFLYVMVLGLFLILISRDLFSEGLSQVGLENAIRSRNINNNGFADFWSQDNGLTIDNRDYLPLGYYIEGKLFSYFNDSYMLEKGFSMILFILCSILIVRVWNLLGMKKSSGWMPLAFFVLCPLVFESSTQNLIELPLTFVNMMAFCMLCHLYNFRQKWTAYKEIHPDASIVKMRFVCTTLSGLAALFLVISFFIKGFSSTFLFFLPLVFWLFDRQEGIGQPFISMFIMVIFSSLIFTILCSWKHAIPVMVVGYLKNFYLTWSNPSIIVGHLWLVWEGIKQSAIAYSVMLMVWILSFFKGEYFHYMTFWKHKDQIPPEKLHNIMMAYRLFSLVLLGVVPLLFSLNPTEYYLIPLLPFVALACSFVSWNTVCEIKKNGSYFLNVTLATLSVVIITVGLVLNYNSISRLNTDGEVLSDIHEILPHLKEGEVVSVTDEVMGDNRAKIYLLRYKEIVFDPQQDHQYLLSRSVDPVGLNKKTQYERITPNTSHIHLYKEKEHNDWYGGEWIF